MRCAGKGMLGKRRPSLEGRPSSIPKTGPSAARKARLRQIYFPQRTLCIAAANGKTRGGKQGVTRRGTRERNTLNRGGGQGEWRKNERNVCRWVCALGEAVLESTSTEKQMS